MVRFKLVILSILIGSCSSDEKTESEEKNTVFKKLNSNQTGIRFKNELIATSEFNVFKYRNFYNGGGVGIADFNRDGLSDIYLVANMGDNQLLINQGNFRFENIAKKAGVLGTKKWSTGVSIADVNGDGWLDIYLCNAGDVEGGIRQNELFINNGDLTFTERAAEFGLDDNGFTTHAVFFDYDKDDDLDCYVLNNSFRPVSSLGYRNLRNERDPFGGHKLYQNQDGHFADVSQEAGIFGSVIGFGLGVNVGDVNQDTWPDLYVSNDFYERDYLYINDKKGGFKESVEEYMGHISMFSMGADMADLNNDGYPEIFTTDMLPQDDRRLKTLIAFESYDVYQVRLKNDYYHQFMRNMLHLNNRNGKFLEIGQLAGVAATDWSWSALIADFDNDQYKEIFVANGIYKDVIDQDFVDYLGSNETVKQAIQGKKVDFLGFVDMMPTTKLGNFLFSRESDLQYSNQSKAFGLDEPGFSNGAAYGDLDNDGDLDLVVNNVNQEVFVYQNQSRQQSQNNFLSLEFKGKGKNTFGLSAEAKVYNQGQVLSYDHMPMRGFQSSMDYKMVIGLGGAKEVDSLRIQWPDGQIQTVKQVKANQHIVAKYEDARPTSHTKKSMKQSLLQAVDNQDLKHVENKFNDFDRDRLQYHMLSTQGPGFAPADLNADGFEDVFMGGSAGKSSVIYLQQPDNQFKVWNTKIFDRDSLTEDVAATFFDADNDGDQDLYVVTGGSEYTGQSPLFLDRLYINDGTSKNPSFRKSESSLPAIYNSGSCVRTTDFDHDGDLDLFVGTRVIPGYYGLPASQGLLINNGEGIFAVAGDSVAPDLIDMGMVTDAAWLDADADGWDDLIIVGEWMPVTVLKNQNGKLVRLKVSGLARSSGWWNRIKATDLDADGDVDLVLGNWGLNSKFRPTGQSPLILYVNDFDKNGSQEPIFAFQNNGMEYPMALRQDIIKQMSSMKKKFVFYKDYAPKSLSDIFDKKLLDNATRLEFFNASTSVALNDGKGNFVLKPLPIEAQVAPVYGIATEDFNGDSYPEIILGGNLYACKPEAGRYDALHGLVIAGSKSTDFNALTSDKSGLDIEGEVRHVALLRSGNKKSLVFIRNNQSSKIFKVKK